MILLTEILSLFECEVLLKNNIKYNKVDIFNQIRAISGIVVVNVIRNDFLENQKTENDEFSLIKIKYIANENALEDIKKLRIKIMEGDKENVGKVEGVLQFLPRLQTIKKIK